MHGKKLKSPHDAYFGIIYIPPENTAYSADSSFSDIEIEFHNFQQDSTYVCRFGDFNSRTAKLQDFYEKVDSGSFITY